MRRFVLTLLASSMVAGCKLHEIAAVASFEGEIDMSTNTGALGTQTMKIKGAKVRSESTGAFAAVNITDMDAKKSWLLDSAAHTCTELDLAAASKAAATTSTTKTKVVKTGRTDTVAGYSCDVWTIQDSSATIMADVCVASGLSTMAMGLGGPFSAFSSGGEGWSEVYSHGFPLRMELLDAKGAPIMKMEATRIEKKRIPDSEFQIPAGYTKLASPI